MQGAAKRSKIPSAGCNSSTFVPFSLGTRQGRTEPCRACPGVGLGHTEQGQQHGESGERLLTPIILLIPFILLPPLILLTPFISLPPFISLTPLISLTPFI